MNADSTTLLAWYDRHRRTLPWRALPGMHSDPYRVWLSEVMLQQTTVKAVIPYFHAFTTRWPSVADLAGAADADVMAAWAGLGYYSRARKLIECARVVAAEHGGHFPQTESALLKLPGIGPYTAAAIAAIAFGEPAVVVDGNIERVTTRLFAIDTPLPAAKPIIKARVGDMTPLTRPGDFAQGMMDLGATICTPRKPACGLCPFREACKAHHLGNEESYPVKPPKPQRPRRFGAAFVMTRGQDILLGRRPPKGLLGGMVEVPGTEWVSDFDESLAFRDSPIAQLNWRRMPTRVEHIFTHFALEVTVYSAEVPPGTLAPEGLRFEPFADLDRLGLPSVMRKIAEVGLGSNR